MALRSDGELWQGMNEWCETAREATKSAGCCGLFFCTGVLRMCCGEYIFSRHVSCRTSFR